MSQLAPRIRAFTKQDTNAAKRCENICGHIAWALLVHSLLLIFFVGHSLRDHGHSGTSTNIMIVLMVSLFVLIGRTFHLLWQNRKSDELPNRYRLHVAAIWGLALALPFLWTSLATA